MFFLWSSRLANVPALRNPWRSSVVLGLFYSFVSPGVSGPTKLFNFVGDGDPGTQVIMLFLFVLTWILWPYRDKKYAKQKSTK